MSKRKLNTHTLARRAHTYAMKDLIIPIGRCAKVIGLEKARLRTILRGLGVYAPYTQMQTILDALDKTKYALTPEQKQELLLPPPAQSLTVESPVAPDAPKEKPELRSRTDVKKIQRILAYANQHESVKKAAQKYGVSDVTIYKWRKMLSGTTATTTSSSVESVPEQAELEQLRQRVAEMSKRMRLAEMQLNRGERLIQERWKAGIPFDPIWGALTEGLNVLRL